MQNAYAVGVIKWIFKYYRYETIPSLCARFLKQVVLFFKLS